MADDNQSGKFNLFKMFLNYLYIFEALNLSAAMNIL